MPCLPSANDLFSKEEGMMVKSSRVMVPLLVNMGEKEVMVGFMVLRKWECCHLTTLGLSELMWIKALTLQWRC